MFSFLLSLFYGSLPSDLRLFIAIIYRAFWILHIFAFISGFFSSYLQYGMVAFLLSFQDFFHLISYLRFHLFPYELHHIFFASSLFLLLIDEIGK